MTIRDPLLDQMYLRLDTLINSFNEDIRKENLVLKEQNEKLEHGIEVLVSKVEMLELQLSEKSVSSTLNVSDVSYDFIPSSSLQREMANVTNFTRSGEKIKAIKSVRTIFGCGLKEAKDFCDQVLWPLVGR